VSVFASAFVLFVWRQPTLRRGIAYSVGLALFSSAAEIVAAVSLMPLLVSLGVNAGSEIGGISSHISPAAWLAVFAVMASLRAAANWQSAVQEQSSTQEIVVLLQSRLYRALTRANWDAVRRMTPPTITSALHTHAYDASHGFSSMAGAITATFLAIGYLVSSSIIFPPVVPVLLTILGLMWILNASHSGRVQVHSDDYVHATTELHQRYEDWVAINRICSLGVDSDKLADRFESGSRGAAVHAINYARSSAATHVTYQVAMIAGILVGVPIAWWLETPPALLIFALLAFLRVLPRAGTIQVGYQGIISAEAPLRVIDRLTEQLASDPAVQPAGQGSLEWQQLQLAKVGVETAMVKGGPRWLVQDIDLKFEHGEWLALTGPTGAGKTTLAEVMLMLVRPDAGELRVDSKAIDEKLAGRWREQAAYVPQDVVLFDATIRDNLKLYVPDASDEELEIVLRQAAGDFITERLPEGLDTRAGPGGRWLSSGERQRIGIARALLRKPGFLVLDEPTAALDTDTQQILMDAFRTLDHKMSVLFITHRPELLQLADKIITIEDGRITRRDDGFRRNDPDSPPP